LTSRNNARSRFKRWGIGIDIDSWENTCSSANWHLGLEFGKGRDCEFTNIATVLFHRWSSRLTAFCASDKEGGMRHPFWRDVLTHRGARLGGKLLDLRIVFTSIWF
jgi:hypothetical protein